MKGLKNGNNNAQKTPNTTKTSNATNTPAQAKPATKVVYTLCHTGNVELTHLGDAKLYAGGWTRGAKSAGCVTIDLTGSEYRFESKIKAENTYGEIAFKRTLDSTPREDVSLAWLSMPIKDYGTPSWGINTWRALATDIYDIMKTGQSVLIACTGGHGRTGLAISIILSLLSIIPVGANPVEYVRKNYCKDSVETLGQENYVYKTLGLNFTADPKQYKTYPSYWYGDDDYYGTYSNGVSSYSSPKSRLKFGVCNNCGLGNKWLYDGVCDTCEKYLDEIDAKIEANKVDITSDLGDCPYCGQVYVRLTKYAEDMICDECQEWVKTRTYELEQKGKSSTICSYCGDNVETPTLYYNSDLICERCYVDLYSAGLTSEVIEDAEKGKIIRLVDERGKNAAI